MSYDLATPETVVGPIVRSMPKQLTLNVHGSNSSLSAVMLDVDAQGRKVRERKIDVPLRTFVLDENSGDVTRDENNDPVLDRDGKTIPNRATQDKIWTNHWTVQEYRAIHRLFLRVFEAQGVLVGGTIVDPTEI